MQLRAAADRKQLAFAEAGLFHETNVKVVETAGDLLALLLCLLRIPKHDTALRAVGEPRAANVDKDRLEGLVEERRQPHGEIVAGRRVGDGRAEDLLKVLK